MAEKRGPGRPRVEKPAQIVGISLYPDQIEWLKAIANQKHGSNVSHLIRKLIDQERRVA